jgi:hypothetical protein
LLSEKGNWVPGGNRKKKKKKKMKKKQTITIRITVNNK